MNVEDINSYRSVVEHTDSYCASVFHLACTTTVGDILRRRSNIKSFGNKYIVVPTKGVNLYAPHWFIECDDNMGIILHNYAEGDKCFATVLCDNEVCIRIAYRFTNPITHETTISDICEELNPLILALLHYDEIKELKDMLGSDDYIQAEFTEQDLKNIMHENDLDGKPADVINFCEFMP